MKRLLIFIITIYKKFTSPCLEALFGKAWRFSPTCSEYTLDMIKQHGAVKGAYLGLIQLSKCHA